MIEIVHIEASAAAPTARQTRACNARYYWATQRTIRQLNRGHGHYRLTKPPQTKVCGAVWRTHPASSRRLPRVRARSLFENPPPSPSARGPAAVLLLCACPRMRGGGSPGCSQPEAPPAPSVSADRGGCVPGFECGVRELPGTASRAARASRALLRLDSLGGWSGEHSCSLLRRTLLFSALELPRNPALNRRHAPGVTSAARAGSVILSTPT